MSYPYLYFFPGAIGDRLFWQAVANLLVQDFPKQTLQHYPAFAGQPNSEGIQNFNELSDWVVAQVQQPSVIIAQSMGGIFAIQAVLQQPALVQAVVLCATSGGIDLSAFSVSDWRQDYQQSVPDVPDWFMQAQVDLSPDLSSIDIPVLLLWGDDDTISPVTVGQYLAQQLPHATLQVVAHGQHDFAQTHAELVAAQIRVFLRENL